MTYNGVIKHLSSFCGPSIILFSAALDASNRFDTLMQRRRPQATSCKKVHPSREPNLQKCVVLPG